MHEACQYKDFLLNFIKTAFKGLLYQAAAFARAFQNMTVQNFNVSVAYC